jgi:SAM-dependent methyltransferase
MRCSQIVRFNWPFYAAAGAVAVLAPLLAPLLPDAWWIRGPAWCVYALVLMWLVTSLAASWLVYDRSQLMQWDWVLQALGFDPASWINIHAGHDESSEALRRIFKGARGRVFDIYTPLEMTERSIARARRQAAADGAAPQAAEPADHRRLPLASGSIDVATLLLAAHELRSDAAMAALFTELRRVLGPGGRIVIAEHLRDAANFLAYGPGFLHFHSRRRWLAWFARHRFDVHREFSITPFVRVFVLRRLT